ncbi:hypothetical protein ACF69X_RS23600 [Escherichia coli]
MLRNRARRLDFKIMR